MISIPLRLDYRTHAVVVCFDLPYCPSLTDAERACLAANLGVP